MILSSLRIRPGGEGHLPSIETTTMKPLPPAPALVRLVPAVLLVLLGACGEDEPEPEPVLRPVRYVQVFATGEARTRSFSGTARAALESDLSFTVAGTVRRVTVSVGDSVGGGAPIAELDPSDYALQVQDAEAAARRAEAESRNAASTYERVQRLYENNNASASDLSSARAGAEAAEAALESARSRLALARSQLEDTRLNAPVAGRVAAVTVEEGENVRAGQTVAVLTSGSRMEVEVGIPEVLIARVGRGDRVGVRFDALGDRTLGGRVTEVSVTADDRMNTYPVTVLLDAPDPDLRPGMVGEVAFGFEAEGGGPRIFVPPAAVGQDRQGRFVYVLEPDPDPGSEAGSVRRRPVRVGELTSGGLEILGGLEDGERVVTAGVSRIQDGQRVRVPAGG